MCMNVGMNVDNEFVHMLVYVVGYDFGHECFYEIRFVCVYEFEYQV